MEGKPNYNCCYCERGAVRYKFNLSSECVNGKQGKVEVVAGGFALGVGITAGATYSSDEWNNGGVTFEDNRTDVDPFVFEGSSKYAGASVAIGFAGYGYQIIKLGDAVAVGGGFQMGWDAAVGLGAGISTVTKSEIIDCEECKE